MNANEGRGITEKDILILVITTSFGTSCSTCAVIANFTAVFTKTWLESIITNLMKAVRQVG